MGRFFNMESPFFQFLSRLADLMILNLLFIGTCIPIVTIGAAWTSMYYVTMKMVRNEESYIVRGYFKSFKENFKQATGIWLIVLAFIIVLFLDFRIVGNMGGTLGSVTKVAISMISILWFIELQYLFPVLAKFYNSTKRTFFNAFLMSVRHLPQTLIMVVISVGAVILTFLNGYTLTYGILIWLMFGFALVALANSWFLVRIFDNYIPKEEDDSKEEETEIDGSVFQNIGTPLPEKEETTDEEA